MLRGVERVSLVQLTAVRRSPERNGWILADVTVMLSLMIGFIVGVFVLHYYRRARIHYGSTSDVPPRYRPSQHNSSIPGYLLCNMDKTSNSIDDKNSYRNNNKDKFHSDMSIPEHLHTSNLHHVITTNDPTGI